MPTGRGLWGKSMRLELLITLYPLPSERDVDLCRNSTPIYWPIAPSAWLVNYSSLQLFVSCSSM